MAEAACAGCSDAAAASPMAQTWARQWEAHGRRRDRTALAFLPSPRLRAVGRGRRVDSRRLVLRRVAERWPGGASRRREARSPPTGANSCKGAASRLWGAPLRLRAFRSPLHTVAAPALGQNHRCRRACAEPQLCWSTRCEKTTRSRRTPCPPPCRTTTTPRRPHSHPSRGLFRNGRRKRAGASHP